MHYKNLLFTVFTFFVVFTACKSDGEVAPNIENNEVVQKENQRLKEVVSLQTVAAFLQGYIKDESNAPIAGVTVKAGGETTTTDEKGYFSFGEIMLNEAFAVVAAKKSSYLNGFRTFTPTAGQVNTVSIQLLSEGNAQSFTAASGGNLSFEGGKVKLDFPADAIVSSSGEAVTGEVKVIARYIDPSTAGFTEQIPGVLAGLTDEEAINGLISYGMVTVELSDAAGNPLEIAENSRVEVRLPAAVDDPEEIPLWHFNETYGLWVEAGKAVKEGSEYIAEVNHFSSWNLDLDFDAEPIEVILRDENEGVIANQAIDVYGSTVDKSKLARVYTDGNGKFTLLSAPQDLEFRIVLPCETIIKEETGIVGQITLVLSSSDISNSRNYTLTGTLTDCDNVVYDNRYFTVYSPTNDNIFFSGLTDVSGMFTLTDLLCDVDENTAYEVFTKVWVNDAGVVKVDTLQVTFNGSSQTIDINYCGVDSDTLSDDFVIPFNDSALVAYVRATINKPSGPITYGDVKDLDSLCANAEICFDNKFDLLNDLEGLQYFRNLRTLYLFSDRGGIDDIDVLSGLANLTRLILWGAEINDVSALSGLKNLNILELYDNQISDISSLSGLTNLTKLYLSVNQISDISSLSGLTNLTTLYLPGNQISDISSLSGLTNLTDLLLYDNQISDVRPLCDLGSSFAGYISLRGNNLNSTDINNLKMCLPNAFILGL